MSSTTTTSESAPNADREQHVNWVFTIQYGGPHQPSRNDVEDLVRSRLHPRASFTIVGHERAPTTGQRHLQGYTQLKKRARRSELVKLIACFWEPAKGTLEQNVTYCSKEGDFFQEGTPTEPDPGQRERDRWALTRDYAIAGDVMRIHPQILVQHYGHIRSIQRDFQARCLDADSVTGIWLYGAAGAGKSYTARREAGTDFYPKMCNKWWDGYQGQKIVIMDDFDTSHACLGHHLKIWADRYAFVAEIKGRAEYIRPQTFYVTSQYSPEEIWPGDEITLAAIRRRFTVRRIGLPTDAPRALVRFVAHNPPAVPIDLTQGEETEEEDVVEASRNRPLPFDGSAIQDSPGSSSSSSSEEDSIQVLRSLRDTLPLRRSVAAQMDSPPTPHPSKKKKKSSSA